MKKLITNLIAAFITYSALASNSPVANGIMELDLTATTRANGGTLDPISKTNRTANSTNVVTISKLKLSQSHVGSAELLALLANSFNTNFPAGSQIGITLGTGFANVFVVDASGTNVIFSPGHILAFLSEDVVLYSGVMVDTTRENASGTSQSDYGTVDATWIGTLSYDDTSLTTADGTHTKFALSGEFVQHNSRPKSKPFINVSGQMQCVAGGPIRDVGTILSGTIRVKPYKAVPES